MLSKREKQGLHNFYMPLNFTAHKPLRGRLVSIVFFSCVCRVNGTLRNIPEFSKVFNCPLGSSMNPKKKCKVW